MGHNRQALHAREPRGVYGDQGWISARIKLQQRLTRCMPAAASICTARDYGKRAVHDGPGVYSLLGRKRSPPTPNDIRAYVRLSATFCGLTHCKNCKSHTMRRSVQHALQDCHVATKAPTALRLLLLICHGSHQCAWHHSSCMQINARNKRCIKSSVQLLAHRP